LQLVFSDAETYVGIHLAIVIYPKSVRRLLRMIAVPALASLIYSMGMGGASVAKGMLPG
jgi:hypothetical protein